MKQQFTKAMIVFLTLLLFNNNFAATFTVTNTSDAGAGSFRQAIIDANTAAGSDIIIFTIGSGAQTITLLSPVSVTTAILIDGSTQPGFAGSPLISIAGSSMFQVSGGNNTTVQYLNFSGIAGSTAILVSSASNCNFNNNNLSNLNTGIRFDGNCSTNTVTSSNMSGCVNGIWLNNGIDPNFTINDNNLQNCTGTGLYYQYGTPASVNNNTFTGSANGIYLQNATNFTLTSPTQAGPNKNYFGSHTGQVLNVTSCNGIVVSNWDFTTLAAPPLNTRTPLVAGNTGSSLFNNNNLAGMNTGIRFDGNCSTNTVTSSNMSGCVNGIWLNNGIDPNFTINDNNLQNCTGTGLYYQYGTPASVNNNTFTGSANGIYLQNATNFTLTSPTQAGPNKNYFGSHTGQVLNVTSCNGIVVSNWDFTTLAAPPLNTRTPLVAGNTGSSLFNNNNLAGMNTGIRFDGNCSTNTVTSSNMSGCVNGIWLNNGIDPNFTINDNNLQNCTGTGLYYQYGTPASVNNNTFTGSANGIYLQNATNFTLTSPTQAGPNKNYFGSHTGQVLNATSCNGIVVSNWDFTTLAAPPLNTRTPLVAGNTGSSLFNNNNLAGMNTGIRFDGNCSTNTVTSSNMSGCVNGIWLNNGIDPNFTINDNNLQNCTGTGLYYQYGTPASVNNNTFTGSANGIYLQNATNFTLTSPTQAGPNKNYFGSHTGQVLNVTSCNGIVVSNWDFTTLAAPPLNTRTPLVAGNTGSSLFNNNNLAGMNTGIRFDGNCSTNTVTSSNMSGCVNGIWLNNGIDPNFTIDNNNVQNCTGWGLYYQYGTPASVNNNTFTGSVNGLYLQNASTFSLGANTFGNQTGNSIQMSSCSSVSITNATTNGNGGHGILINQSNNCVINNNFSCGRTYGIRIQGSSNQNSILNGNLGSSTTGIQLDNTSVNNTTINAVSFSGNGTDIFNGGLNTVISGTTTGNFTPTVTVNSGSICSGQSFTMVPGGAITYTFQGGNAVVSPTANSTYTVVGTGTNGCISSAAAISSVTVNANPTITVNSGSICSGTSFTMVPGGANTYTFQGGSAIVSPTANASYTVVGTSTAGCMSPSFATSGVTVNANPTITVNSGSICSGQSFTMVPAGANTYTFQGGSAVVSPTVNSTYTIAGTSTAGCVSPAFATSGVTVNANPTITVNSGSICSGQSFTMVPGGANTYTFEGGSAVVTPTANTSYTVVGTSTAGCLSPAFATSGVTVNANPTITVNSGSVCSGQSFTMVPSGASTYTFGGGNAVVSPTTNTSYTVTGTSTAGCVSPAFATSNITVNPLPTVNAVSSSSMLCSGQSATLTSGGANAYSWSSGGNTANEVVTPTITTSYTVVGTDTNGCSNSAVVTQSVTDCTGIAINKTNASVMNVYPNPNNGEFTISLNSACTINIINHLGQVISAEELEAGNHSLNIGSFANGVYMIQAISGGQQHFFRMIKQ